MCNQDQNLTCFNIRGFSSSTLEHCHRGKVIYSIDTVVMETVHMQLASPKIVLLYIIKIDVLSHLFR